MRLARTASGLGAGGGLLVMLLASADARGQSASLGGRFGLGPFSVSSGSTAYLANAGIEACVFCRGRAGLFAEYTHWFSGGYSSALFSPDRVRSADLAGAGLRIQSRGSTRIFFDIGVVGGRDDHRNRSGGALGGGVVGFGVEMPIGEHWYLRPQVRAYGLSPHSIEGLSAHWSVSGSAGFGYRF